VTADGVSDVTDVSGFFSVEVSPGIYDVTAEMAGYESETVLGVSVAADATVVQDFALVPEVEVRGTEFPTYLVVLLVLVAGLAAFLIARRIRSGNR